MARSEFQSPESDVTVESDSIRLYVNVRRTKDGPILAQTVSEADRWDYYAEAWHAVILRRGRPDIALEDVRFELRPIYQSRETGLLTGFSLETNAASGMRLRYTFTLHAIEHIAVGASRELINSGVLQMGEEYHYELCAEKAPEQTPDANRGIAITTSSAKLLYVSFPIQRLWKQAKKIGPEDEQLAPVFYAADALKRAEQHARRGGNQQSPIETGCMLVGTLCSCPETGEFYVVVRDALEAQDAESQSYSLEFSDRTWTRMQAILRARQSRPDGRADRFTGNAHGHPFLPNGGPPCELCADRPEVPCARTSCFASPADSDWCRAIFGRQPWQLCHIFGLNARQEPVDKLFGLRNGQLVERGFAVVPEFAPENLMEADGQAPDLRSTTTT